MNCPTGRSRNPSARRSPVERRGTSRSTCGSDGADRERGACCSSPRSLRARTMTEPVSDPDSLPEAGPLAPDRDRHLGSQHVALPTAGLQPGGPVRRLPPRGPQLRCRADGRKLGGPARRDVAPRRSRFAARVTTWQGVGYGRRPPERGDRRMLVVVTGASGFIGRYLQAWLASRCYDVVGAARAGSDRAGLVPLDPDGLDFRHLLERGPDVLVHAAGMALVTDSLTETTRDFESNTALYQGVLEAVRQAPPACRVVLVSSAAVYGNPASLPISESAPIAPISPYGYHKAMAEQLGQMYHQIFGLKTCAVRVFSAYGRGLRRQVVYDAIRMLRASHPGRGRLPGHGPRSAGFHSCRRCRSRDRHGDPGSSLDRRGVQPRQGVSVTIAELVEIARSQLDMPTDATFDGVLARGHPLEWRADIGRLKALGFTRPGRCAGALPICLRPGTQGTRPRRPEPVGRVHDLDHRRLQRPSPDSVDSGAPVTAAPSTACRPTSAVSMLATRHRPDSG